MEFTRHVMDDAGKRPAKRFPPPAPVAVPRGGRQPLLADDLEALLRQRLRGVAIFALAALIIILVLALAFPDSAFRRDHPAFVAVPWFAFVMAALILPLFSAWPRTLARLRMLEVALFGTISIQFALGLYLAFPHGSLIRDGVSHDSTVYVVMGDNHVLRWFALIAVYGIFIPNTGRYCTWFVLGMAATPLLVLFAVAVVHPPLRTLIMTSSVWHTSFWMTAAVVLALYGSNKLSVLREAAFEARRVGQYQIERLLGEGGAGAVYLATQQRLRRPCALKIIRPEKAGDPTAQRRFENEVQAMAELNHPNCIEIYDYGRADDGSLFYAMEYLDGIALWDMVEKRGALPAARVIALLRQLCAALGAVHARGLVHRDVKPRNIMVSCCVGVGDVAKLLDFGLVQVDPMYDSNEERVTLEGKTVGTPWFMSPEQIVAKSRLDGRSDLYSLGATAYYLLSGQLPFERPNVIDVFSAHLHEAPTPLTRINDDIPADLQEVVLQCLEKQPENRFADAEALDRALGACRDAGRWDADAANAWWQSLRKEEGQEVKAV